MNSSSEEEGEEEEEEEAAAAEQTVEGYEEDFAVKNAKFDDRKRIGDTCNDRVV